MKRKSFGFIIVMMLIAAGCASQSAPAPAAMEATSTSSTEAMMSNISPTPETMMGNSTETPEAMMGNSTITPDAMMTNETATPEAMMSTSIPNTGFGMMDTTSTPEGMAPTSMAMTETMTVTGTPGGMMMGDDWSGAALTDVNTGKSFKLSEYNGKFVLVELITTQSSVSLQQQKNIQAYLAANKPDLVVVSLDVGPKRNTNNLHDHIQMNNFQWSFAVASSEVLQGIGTQFGSQFTDPANTSLILIDQKGDAFALPINLVSMDAIKGALVNYLPKM